MKPVRKALCCSLDSLSDPAQGTLPYNANPPAIRQQGLHDPIVVCPVSSDFFAPEFRAGGRPFEKRAIMPMPEASMHEYDGMVAREDDVRFSWQLAGMKAKPETLAVECAAHQNFRSGITPAYAGHHPAAGGAVHHINHYANSGNVRGAPSRSSEISA